MTTKWTNRTNKWAVLAVVGVFATIGCASSGSKAPMTPSTSAKSEAPPAISPDSKASAVQAATSGTIYFDTDRSELRDDARAALRTNAAEIKSNPGWGAVTIEGHCDERGSDEYNLALGERRATKVKRYLQDLGVKGSRLQTVSYGETKPAVRGHEESAWKKNRRSELEVGVHHASTR